MTFLKNAWYMAGWEDELDGGAMIARRIINIPVVVYRDLDNGAVHALMDRCAHRFAPLSKGTVLPEGIQCGYHGLTFNHDGQCIRNFFAKTPPPTARVRKFAVCERPGVIWVWMGDFEMADEGLIPAIRHHEDAAMRYVKGITTVKSDYLLLSDNLMDLSHSTFLHPAFGGLEYNPRFRSEEMSDGSIVSDYVIDDIINIYGQESIPAERIRVRDTIRWFAPSTHILESTGGLRENDENLVDAPSAHILSPETEFTTHYFWSSGLALDSPIPDDELHAILKQTFDNEDKPMVEAVRDRMDDAELWDLNPVLLPTDAGAVRMRRKLTAMIKAEVESA